MSNFAFVTPIWPELAQHAKQAESYLFTDPRSACIMARLTAEQLVKYLYDLLDLRVPQGADLHARIRDGAFARRLGPEHTAKLDLIRLHGNAGAHGRPVSGKQALQSMRELHHVLLWAAYRYSTQPEALPMGAAFDERLAKQRAAVPGEKVLEFVEKAKARDEASRRRIEESEELRAEQDRQLAELRQQLEQLQSRLAPDPRDYQEAQTRADLIDPLLAEAGWLLQGANDREYPVDGMPNAQGKGFVDYVLWGDDGLPLAVVEAKRSGTSLEVGKQQAKLYADALERRFGRRPVIFVTTGYEHELWDDAGGYPPRRVDGFFTKSELEYLVAGRTRRLPLDAVPVDASIASRHYQQRAIRAIGDAFEQRRRDALLVMATGTGKTRTVVALVDQLMKASWVRKVLFLADRTALVKQAHNAFKTHLPSSSPVNLLESRDVAGARVVISTYQTMLGQLEVVGPSGERKFGPGYFDLVVIDEAHRSVYAKYGQLFEYFDGLLVGLTATPKDEIDHNTYRLFHLEDGVPTDAYSLDEAVADGYLVPFQQVPVTTKFQDAGIHYDDLSEEEREAWDLAEWGEGGPPDAVASGDLGRYLFNEDTVDKVLEQLMTHGLKVADGDRLGKTIIFAANQRHAEFIEQRFNAGWPEHAGRFARVITHSVNYAQSLIDDFAVAEKSPHIAISVDMLDTGIDVPDVVNLVFFKKVFSRTKFWQMLGRGTRLRPDLFGPGKHKTHFLVFDFCRNLEFFLTDDVPVREGRTQKSITQRLVEHRVALVAELDRQGIDHPVRGEAAEAIRAFLRGMNLDNVMVRRHRKTIERYTAAEAWATVGESDVADLATVAGLPSAELDDDVKAKKFDVMVLSGQLALLSGDAPTLDKLRLTVQAMADELLTNAHIPVIAREATLLEEVRADAWWTDVTLDMLERLRRHLRGLVQLLEERQGRAPVYADFEDTLIDTEPVAVRFGQPGVDLERFRARTGDWLRLHLDHLALQRLRRNKPLTQQDLDALEQMLREAGATDQELDSAITASGGLGLFIRSLVGLEREAAVEAFAAFLQDTSATVEQIRFVNLIVDELTAGGVMEPGRLFESPYTDRATIDYLFPEERIELLFATLAEVRGNAVPTAS